MAALKDATIIKTKKADWRLVAAAQAMLRDVRDTALADIIQATLMLRYNMRVTAACNGRV